MALSRIFAFSLIAVARVCSAGMFALSAASAAASRALDAFVAAALGTAPPQPVPHLVVTPSVIGQPQARAFAERRIMRVSTRRARAPDSAAFVTA